MKKTVKTIEECLAIYDEIGLPTDFEQIVKDSFTLQFAYKDAGLPVHHCSSCGHEFRIKSIHGETVKCPNCQLDLRVFHTRSNTNYSEHGYCTMINRLVKYQGMFVHTRVLAEMSISSKKSKCSTSLREIQIIDGDQFTVYSYTFGFVHTWINRKLNMAPSFGCFYGNLYAVDLYPNNYVEFFSDTSLKYSCLGLALGSGRSNMDVMKYILIASQYKYLEFLWKTGNHELYHEMLHEVPVKRELNYIIRHHKKVFKLGGWNARNIVALQTLSKQLPLTDELVKSVNQHPLASQTALQCFDETVHLKSLSQVIFYLSKSNTDSYYFEDYIKIMSDIGTPVDKNTIFPKDLRKAHDDAVQKFNTIKYELKNKQAKNILLKLKQLEYTDNELMIIAPSNLDQILNEGKSLSHCVGSYIDRVVAGSTTILFVRRTSDPNVPYYTLEYQSKKIQQCRGMRNAVMPEEVKDFTEKWLKHVNKQKRKVVTESSQICITQ